MKEVTRDKGYVAVEARTNVEIAELSSSALDTVDISEVSYPWNFREKSKRFGSVT